MPRSAPETIVPSKLRADEREALTDALLRVRCDTFEGVDRADFARRVVSPAADETRILVHRDAQGEVVGYFAAHLHRCSLHGAPVIVVSIELAARHGHRGVNAGVRGGFAEVARVVARHPATPVYLLACALHPSGYDRLARYARPVWPGPADAPDGELLALMSELAEGLGLPPAGDDPLVRRVGWRARETDAERAFWRRSERPAVRYFLERNPGYAEGNGLLAIAPMDPAHLGSAVGRVARVRALRSLEDVRARAHHLPLASRWLLPAERRRRLRALPLLRGLDDARVAALAERARVVTVPAGAVVVREGERSDELFVIDSGSVLITASRRDGEVVLDRLDAGDVFGEVAALTGEARTATARAATRATLVTLSREALFDAMARDAALADAVWARYAERRFDHAAEAQPALARLGRAARAAFLRQGRAIDLPAGGRHELPGPAYLFVVRGEVALEHAGARVTAAAPMLFENVDALRVEARSPARLVALPPAPEPSAGDLFRGHPLLARLSERGLADLLAHAAPLELERGQWLFEAGAPADAFYLLRSGAIDVVLGGASVARLGAGECFGERGLDPSGPGVRTAGARALGRTSLLRVPAAAFRAIAGPTVFGSDRAPAHPQDELPTLLGGVWASEPSPEAEERRFPAGATIVSEHDDADAAWYLVEGVARVEQGGRVVGQVRPGQSFGERGVLMGARRAASVIAETDVVANRVRASAFRAWAEANPRLGDLLASLTQVHRSPDGARTVAVLRGTHEGHPCVTSVARLPDGRSFTATKLEDRPVLVLATDDGLGPPTERVEYERAAPGQRRLLEHRGERALAVVLEGDLRHAAACGEALRRGAPLTRGDVERFRWTGRLGAPAGADRLVCGCVGLTRAELGRLQAAGCGDAGAVGARCGAGTVCGGCVPLVRRLLDDGAGAGPERHADEVDLEAFEARLDGLRRVDTSRSLCGPETVTWRVYGETVALLGSLRALLLQFAHPASQALVEHSALTSASPARLHRTLESMYGMAFGEGATMLRLAREVHEKHGRVVGRYAESHGRIRAGDRYAANQIELLLWVAATVVDTSVCTHEALIGPLSDADKDRLIAEAADLFGLFGIPQARFPQDWAAFRRYFDGVLASGVLYVNANSRALADSVLRSPAPQSAGLFWALRRLTARWLPESLREPYGLDDGPADRAAGAALERSVRLAVPRLPHGLRVCPARQNAEHRLRGEEGVAPSAARLDRVIAFALGVDAGAPHGTT
ncbi:MAG: cyclic nucleotide-binding domain-containing protein [Polyangiales bacterium]